MTFVKNLSIIIYQVLALALIYSFLFTTVELLEADSETLVERVSKERCFSLSFFPDG